jgi:Leucine-rich repeat (LRR) protein
MYIAVNNTVVLLPLSCCCVVQLHQLPDSISALTKLRALSVASNRLWQLPAGISHCSALRLLDCSHNQLGKLPQKLSQLINLRSLKLTHNRHVLVLSSE